MKREFLTNLGLTEEQVNKIMDENGRDIEKYRKDVEKYSKESEKYKTQYESTKSSLDEANKTIASYKDKDMDIEKIQKSADEWKQKYETDTKDLNEKLIAQERSHAMDSYFSGMKFTSESAKRGIMAQFNEQNFELKEGKFIGADEYIKTLQESDSGAFVKEETNNVSLPTFSRGLNTQISNDKKDQASGFGFSFNGVRAKPKEN